MQVKIQENGAAGRSTKQQDWGMMFRWVARRSSPILPCLGAGIEIR